MLKENIHKVGGKTAAIVILATGLAILGEFLGMPAVIWLINIWPVFLIVLGIEYFFARPTDGGKSPPLAIGKIVTSLMISFVAIVALQGWYFVSDTVMGNNGTRLPDQTISPDVQTDQFILENRNGSAQIISHELDHVIVEANVRGNMFSFFNTRAAAKEVEVTVEEEGNAIVVGVENPSFGYWFFQSRPNVHFTIFLPEKRAWDLDVEQRNGTLSLQDVNIKDEARLQTTNGNIKASKLAGHLYLQSTNGNIEAHAVSGILDTRTTNGRIEILGDAEQVQARTTNGKLTVESSAINGDWDLSTTNGSINLKLPKDGHFSFSGKTTNGSVSASRPLEIDGKKVRGTVGQGEFEVEASTTNGSFTVELQ